SEAIAVLRENGIEGEPRIAVWDAMTLAMLSAVHQSPAVEIGLTDFESALTLPEELEVLRSDAQPFQPDAPRDAIIQRIRERAAASGDDALILMLHGDAGVGKTRTVAEALNADNLRDGVLYVNGIEEL